MEPRNLKIRRSFLTSSRLGEKLSPLLSFIKEKMAAFPLLRAHDNGNHITGLDIGSDEIKLLKINKNNPHRIEKLGIIKTPSKAIENN
jgi:hypothetical protein